MPTLTLDKTDLKILHALQSDARISNTELADRVGLSPSPCLRRVRTLEESGVIKRYAGILDPSAIGLPISVFVNVSLRSQERASLEDFEQQVLQYPEVMECYLMTGSFDYMLRVVLPDLDSYQRFLADKLTRIKSVANIQSSMSLKQVVYKTALPLGVDV
jgi:Lrp/AsnC family leucine-responsive transcriptional regulator